MESYPEQYLILLEYFHLKRYKRHVFCACIRCTKPINNCSPNKETLETQERSKRGVLLTDKEFDSLKDGFMDTKSRSKLHEKLDTKFEYLIEELEVISTSPVLEPWREITCQYYEKFQDLSRICNNISNPKQLKSIYLDMIVSAKVSGETAYYIIEVKQPSKSAKTTYYSKRIFDEANVLRGIKARKEVKKILLKAYKKKFRHTLKKDAKTLPELKQLLRE